MARDWSHGKVKTESVKDYGSYRLRVNGALIRETGGDLESFDFTESDIREHMPTCSAGMCAFLLLLSYGYFAETGHCADSAMSRMA